MCKDILAKRQASDVSQQKLPKFITSRTGRSFRIAHPQEDYARSIIGKSTRDPGEAKTNHEGSGKKNCGHEKKICSRLTQVQRRLLGTVNTCFICISGVIFGAHTDTYDRLTKS